MEFIQALTHFEILFALFMGLVAAALAANGIVLHKRLADEKKAWDYGFRAVEREEISAAYQDMTRPARLERELD